MDREIKFRVFDTEVGEMVDTNMHFFGEAAAFGRVESWIIEHREAKGDRTILERLNDMIAMEYTGMEDKSGQEIWEGDVLDWDGEIVVAKIENGHLLGRNEDRAGYIYEDFLEAIEVIGNKFENPDLHSEVKDD